MQNVQCQPCMLLVVAYEAHHAWAAGSVQAGRKMRTSFFCACWTTCMRPTGVHSGSSACMAPAGPRSTAPQTTLVVLCTVYLVVVPDRRSAVLAWSMRALSSSPFWISPCRFTGVPLHALRLDVITQGTFECGADAHVSADAVMLSIGAGCLVGRAAAEDAEGAEGCRGRKRMHRARRLQARAWRA
jgi:hypothetical protein